MLQPALGLVMSVLLDCHSRRETHHHYTFEQGYVHRTIVLKASTYQLVRFWNEYLLPAHTLVCLLKYHLGTQHM